MDNLEKPISPEITQNSPNQSLEKVSVSPNQTFPSQTQDDSQQQNISSIKEKISGIPSENKKNQDDQSTQPVNLAIKNLEDLLDIKGSELKFKALLKFAGSDREKQDKALDWAREVWEETAEAYLLDLLRDELAKIA